LMTPGLPDSSSLMRIHYPVVYMADRPSEPILWTDTSPKKDCLNIISSMCFNWPSWAPDSEYLLLPIIRKCLNPTTFHHVFNVGWSIFGERLTLPLLPDAEPAPSPREGWPVVVFSHGMGCTRASMSQLCYQLASQGVVVVALEHREGSGSISFYREARGGARVEVPHRVLSTEDPLGESWVRSSQVLHRAREVHRVLSLLQRIQKEELVDNVFTADSTCAPSPLAGKLDLSSLHLMGHSFGGASVLLVASQLERLQLPLVSRLVALDPWMFPVRLMEMSVNLPLLVMNSEAFILPENLCSVQMATKCNQDVEWEVLNGGVHLSATDIPMLFPQVYLRKGLGFMSTLSAEEAIAKTNSSVWGFLNWH